jgi:uncharacterized surface anchored protein
MEKSIKLKITGKDYMINYPSIGQILDIESLKSALTNGTYGDLVKMNTRTANEALDIADTIATFSILIPEIKDQLNIKTYTEMDPFVAKKLVTAYKKQFFPWFNEINEELRKFGNDEE